MTRPFGLLCPLALACEALGPRWTFQILMELWNGSSRFNDIRKGLGGISSALLSKRLKEMEGLGLIERVENKAKGCIDYFRTEKAIRLEPVMSGLAEWAQCNIDAETALAGADLPSLMWTTRRMIVVAELPRRRLVFRFHFRDDPAPTHRHFWFMVEPGGDAPELCTRDPGRDVDLYVETGSVSLGAIIEGRSTVEREAANGRLFLSGDHGLARSMSRWLRVSSYAALDGVLPLA